MPEISYNRVALPYCRTTKFDQQVVYEAETDWFRQDFSIDVETYFTADYLQLLFPQLVGTTDNAADIMMVIRSKLMQPRREFSVKCAGVELLPTPAPDGNGVVDARNGPQPQYCNVLQLNDANFIVNWSIKASYWENNDVTVNLDPKVRPKPGNPVLVNRWSETQDIDNCLYTTRTREGKYIIRSDNSPGFIVDRFRENMAILGVPNGFLRESASYTVSPDGLSLSYRIVDKEQFKMPPDPAYEASGTYTEQVLKFGAMRWGEVKLRLRAPRTADQGKMVRAALGIASQKLEANGAKKVNVGQGNNAPIRFSILEQCSLTVGLYDNTVDIWMRARMLPSKVFLNGANPDAGKWWAWNEADLTFTPGTDNDGDPLNPGGHLVWPIGGTTTGPLNRMLLQAAAYYDPSLRDLKVDPATGQFDGNRLEVGQAGQRREP